MPGSTSFKSQMKRADASLAQWALIAGESEVAANTVAVKHLRDAAGNQVFEDQQTVSIQDVKDFLLRQ